MVVIGLSHYEWMQDRVNLIDFNRIGIIIYIIAIVVNLKPTDHISPPLNLASSCGYSISV